jgi:hypothetical protein
MIAFSLFVASFVAWFLSMLAGGGSPFILRDELGKEVYFDQNGELTTRFGIKATPAIVVQDGENLKIVEVAINPVNGVGS